MKAEIIQNKIIGVDEIVHPHNDAMQLIDKRIKEIKNEYERLMALTPKSNRTSTTLQHMDLMMKRMKSLEQSKEILMISGEVLPDDYEIRFANYLDKIDERAYHGRQRPIAMYDLDDNFIKKYDSVAECALENDINSQYICRCARGESKSTHGYKFEYVEKEI